MWAIRLKFMTDTYLVALFSELLSYNCFIMAYQNDTNIKNTLYIFNCNDITTKYILKFGEQNCIVKRLIEDVTDKYVENLKLNPDYYKKSSINNYTINNVFQI